MMPAARSSPTNRIVPLVLSGGAGTRLWPVSRTDMPKQFLKFGSSRSLLQETLLRCKGEPFESQPIIVALQGQAEVIQQQASEIGMNPELVLEPARRDSCAAVLAGAYYALKRSPDAIIMILAADHFVSDPEAFRAEVAAAASAAADGYIVTFGVTPAFPATGYGYILPGAAISGSSCKSVARFREKPEADVARQYIAEGCLWNSGNFLARADVLVREANSTQGVWEAVEAACSKGRRAGIVNLPDGVIYSQAAKISFDYAIMEKTSRAAVQAVSYAWSDIGTWDSVAKVLPCDAGGNAIQGNAAVVDGTGNLVFSDGPLTVVQGLDDVIVIATGDAILVARRGESEKVKALAEELPKRGLTASPGPAGRKSAPGGSPSGSPGGSNV
jgi:mannose-1-phosphate guanylyltransferase/mannose-6-phosphate isomerase